MRNGGRKKRHSKRGYKKYVPYQDSVKIPWKTMRKGFQEVSVKMGCEGKSKA
jgi:hypothetical protein